MVTHKGILVRINPKKNTIEHTKNKGTSWTVRCSLTNKGIALALTDLGDELFLESSNNINYIKLPQIPNPISK